MIKNNLFAHIPGDIKEELFQEILNTEDLRMERIVSPPGHASPPGFWYDQETAEWVLLVQGSATIRFYHGGEVALTAGDYLLIAQHERHRIESTDPNGETIWLAIHFRGSI